MPRRPARPVSWVYWARGEELVVLAGELGELLDHHRAGRHVDAHGERLGGEHHLHQPLDEAASTDLLERRHHAGVVGGDAGLEPRGTGRSRARPGRRRLEVAEAIARRSRGCGPLVGGGEPQTGVEAGCGGVVALVAAEDEVDRRQHRLVVEQLDDVDPAGVNRRRGPRRRPPCGGPGGRGRSRRAGRLGVGAPSTSVGSRWSRRGAVADEVEVASSTGRRSSTIAGRAAHGA
jgi:hypothetical protein